MPKRLILCFDGTWNKPDDDKDRTVQVETNVRRFYESILPQSLGDGKRQYAWYDRGVGTKWYERFRGGAFGLGLDKNIVQGYTYLAETYEPEDEIYLFGFSRGAYTARSLVGLIRNSGLLRKECLPARSFENKTEAEIEEALDELIEEDLVTEAYEIYRTRDEGADTPTAIAFRNEYSREVPIHFLGVWDTVGALGIPLRSFLWFNKRKYEFHDTELSRIVQHAYHAVAIDEHREEYDVTLWRPKAKPVQTMEQRWFMGAHSDVGGGYVDRRLSDLTLFWMQKKAEAVGLALDHQHVPVDLALNHLAPATDSFMQFFHGIHSKFHARYYRAMLQTEYGNEVLDESVTLRCTSDTMYRPRNMGFPISFQV